MRILVTGATGQLGGKVVETLLQTGPPATLAVSVRDPGKAGDLRDRGVEVRQGDFDAPASLDDAFADVDRLLIVSTNLDNATRTRQHRTAVEAASRVGVGFIAYTSMAKADTNPIALAEVHRATEEAIRATGIPFCFLRNNWYVENEASSVHAAAEGSPILTAAGNGRVGWAARDDYAEAAAAVLAGSGHENTVYELSGPPRTYAQFAEVLEGVLDRKVPVNQVDDDTYETVISGFGLPDFVVDMLTDVQKGIRQGALDVVSDDLETLLGRPLTSLQDALTRIARG